MTDSWNAQMKALGAFIRSQRKLANLSLRQLADLTTLSNPYLSQIERGLQQPSVRVLAKPGARGAAGDEPAAASVESAISADERLADEQKAALLAVYRSMLRS